MKLKTTATLQPLNWTCQYDSLYLVNCKIKTIMILMPG